MRQRHKKAVLALSILFLVSAIGLLVVELRLLPAGTEYVLVIALVVACAIPVLIAWLSRSFDPFEPVYPVAIATVIYFGLMAIIVLSSGHVSMLSVDYRDDMPTVVFLALLALLGFYAAYYGAASVRRQGRGGSAPSLGDLPHVHRRAWLLLGFFALLFVAWIVIGRVPLWSLWIFGGASYGTWNVEATGAKLGHLYAAQEALPACVLLIIATRTRRRWSLAHFGLIAVIIVLFAGLGVRARILLMVGSVFAFYYLEREKRPTAWQIALIALAIFYFVIGAIGYYRGTESDPPAGERYRLTSAWDKFVEGSDIATTTALYVHWVPVFGYDWGREFLGVALTPIPSAVWPDKYTLLGTSPIEDYRAMGAAAAFFVTFYRSFGPVGVVWGMALIGWLCRRVYDRYRANPQDIFAQISVALLWAYMFHMYGRHSVTLIVYGVVYVFAPVWIMSWLVSRNHMLKHRARSIILHPLAEWNNKGAIT